MSTRDDGQIDSNYILIDGRTTIGEWPNCPVPDCEYKVCLWGGVGLCYPCSARLLGMTEMERRYGATH